MSIWHASCLSCLSSHINNCMFDIIMYTIHHLNILCCLDQEDSADEIKEAAAPKPTTEEQKWWILVWTATASVRDWKHLLCQYCLCLIKKICLLPIWSTLLSPFALPFWIDFHDWNQTCFVCLTNFQIKISDNELFLRFYMWLREKYISHFLSEFSSLWKGNSLVDLIDLTDYEINVLKSTKSLVIRDLVGPRISSVWLC